MSPEPKTVAIYSVGLLGGSIGLGLKASGYAGRILGMSSRSTLPVALKLGCIDEGFSYDNLGDIVSGTDLLILCSPIGGIIETIGRLAALSLPEGLVITDVGSTKQDIMAAARALPAHVRFIGGHPMAGSDKSGPAAADPFLFQNAVHVLTPPDGEATSADRDLASFFERRLGSKPLFLDPFRHDRIVAAVSHLPHLLAVALVNEAQEVEEEIPGTLDLAAGGFRDMTRIAGAGYGMWRDIFATNKGAVAPLIDGMIRRLSDIKRRLSDDSLGDLFEHSAATRRRIPQNAKGFIRRLCEVLVVVKDQPGMIAAIADCLTKENINISDIEVMKVREGEAGTIRLAFDSPTVAAAAVSALSAAGIAARERT